VALRGDDCQRVARALGCGLATKPRRAPVSRGLGDSWGRSRAPRSALFFVGAVLQVIVILFLPRQLI